jgi:hypothetical protein
LVPILLCTWVGAGAGYEPELLFLGLPNAVVVGDALAWLEAQGMELLFDGFGYLVPRPNIFFENVGALEVGGHFFLVPSLAHNEQAMGGPVIVQEDQILFGLPDGCLQAGETLHFSKGLLGLGGLPVLQCCLPHSSGPFLQLCIAAWVWVVFGGPCDVVLQ